MVAVKCKKKAQILLIRNEPLNISNEHKDTSTVRYCALIDTQFDNKGRILLRLSFVHTEELLI